MKSNHFNCGCTVFVILILTTIMNDGLLRVHACDLDQAHHGCRIDNGACSCAYGCKSEFRYSNLKECNDALKGRSGDGCSSSPCLHKGQCIQITKSPGYRCLCAGTTYHGGRCQIKCPDNIDKHTPSTCILF